MKEENFLFQFEDQLVRGDAMSREQLFHVIEHLVEKMKEHLPEDTIYHARH
jgi:hypothetical protein